MLFQGPPVHPDILYDGVIFLITLEYCREAGFDIAGPIGFRALVRCYAVPLLFFAVMGGIFTSVMPESRETLVQSMTVFAVTMGALPPSQFSENAVPGTPGPPGYLV